MLKQFTPNDNYNSPIISLCSHSGAPSKQCAPIISIKAPTQKRTHLELHHPLQHLTREVAISDLAILDHRLKQKKSPKSHWYIRPSVRQFISVWANNVRRNSFVFRATAIASSLFHLCCTCICECGHNAFGQTPFLIMFHLRLLLILLQLRLLLIVPMYDWLTVIWLVV